MYCNGSDITEGRWTGGKTPDLNGLFLRGGDEDNVLDTEEDQLQDHHHVDSGHSHDCTASSSAQPHQHIYTVGKESTEGLCKGDCHVTDTGSEKSKETEDTTVIVETTCDLGDDVRSNIGGVDKNGAHAGTETRPANMRVLYIIRVA